MFFQTMSGKFKFSGDCSVADLYCPTLIFQYKTLFNLADMYPMRTAIESLSNVFFSSPERCHAECEQSLSLLVSQSGGRSERYDNSVGHF
jgi:hypothetical protein